MRNDVIWAIRDARNLKTNEKTFLFVVESRGETFASAETNALDMNMSLKTYYRVREALLDKQVLKANERPGQPTVYTVDAEGLVKLTRGSNEGLVNLTRPPLVKTTRGVSPNLLEGSSQNDQTKKNLKNKDKNKEEEERTDADAPVPSPSNLEIKKEVEMIEVDLGVREVPLTFKEAIGLANQSFLSFKLKSREKNLVFTDFYRFNWVELTSTLTFSRVETLIEEWFKETRFDYSMTAFLRSWKAIHEADVVSAENKARRDVLKEQSDQRAKDWKGRTFANPVEPPAPVVIEPEPEDDSWVAEPIKDRAAAAAQALDDVW